MTACEKFTHRGLTVRIEYDTDPESPRDWDNLGTMVCWHRRYTLGDKHNHADPEAFLYDLLGGEDADRIQAERDTSHEELDAQYVGRYGCDEHLRRARELDNAHMGRLLEAAEKDHVILPLYLYDHSGITMSTTGFSCPWDSGQVGYIYCSIERAEKETGYAPEELREKTAEQLRGEVETYDDFLTGQVYGYVVENEEGDDLDSCWGFYGLRYCREEAKSAADSEADDMDAAAATEATEREFWARQDVVTVDA